MKYFTLREIFDVFGETVKNFLSKSEAIPEEFLQEKAMSMTNIYDQVFAEIMKMEQWMWLIDLYVEEKTMFAIFAQEGMLYRAEIMVENSKVSIGEIIPVQEFFEPIEQNKFLIKKNADGSSRWFLIASSNVLDRSGAINSKKLFDNLVRRAYDEDKWPYLTFFHLGKPFEMGLTDWVSREENLLLASGTFHESLLANCMIKAYEADPKYWGASISYWPLDGSMEEVSKDISLPVYTDGYFEEISILPENWACCLFTALKAERKVSRMKPEVEEAIKKLAGDDEIAEGFISMVDDVNKSIDESNLVRRSASTEESLESSEESSSAEETTAIEPSEESQEEESGSIIELDDELIADIVESLSKHDKITEMFTDMRNQIKDFLDSVSKLSSDLAQIHALAIKQEKKFDERLLKLEKEENEKQEEWKADLPRSRKTVSIHRARVQSAEAPESYEEIAKRTVEIFN